MIEIVLRDNEWHVILNGNHLRVFTDYQDATSWANLLYEALTPEIYTRKE
jgi:hypothetical protein